MLPTTFQFSSLMLPVAAVLGVITSSILLWLFWKAVPSVPELRFVWHGLFIEAPPVARAWWPLWLFLLIAALGALTVACMIPLAQVSTEVKHHVVVLMEAGVEAQAIDGSGKTRLTQLAEAVTKMALARPIQDAFLLVAVGVEPRVIGTWGDAAALRTALQGIEPGDAPANWPAAFDTAMQLTSNEDGVLVVAAGRPHTHYKSWLAATRHPGLPHVLIRRGEAIPNAGIESVIVTHSPFSQRTKGIDVDVIARFRSFGDDQQRWIRATINGKRLGPDVPLQLQADTPVTLPMKNFPQSGVLTLRLLPPDGQPADDVAHAIIPEPRRLDVGILASSPTIAQRLAGLPNLSTRIVTQDALKDSEMPEILIADQRSVLPDDLPAANTLFYAGRGARGLVVPLGINDEHPLAQSLGDPELGLVWAWPTHTEQSDVVILAARADADGVPYGTPLPLVWTSSRARRRAVYVAFDPFIYNYQQYRQLPMLLVNTLEWLAPSMGAPLASTAGVAVPLTGVGPGELSLVRVTADQTPTPSHTIPSAATYIAAAAIERAGVYKLRRDNREVRTFAVNAVALPILSEATPNFHEVLAADQPASRTSTVPRDHGWWWLGLGLLVLETLVYIRFGRLVSAMPIGRSIWRAVAARRHAAERERALAASQAALGKLFQDQEKDVLQ